MEKVALPSTTGMLVDVVPSISVSEDPETPGAVTTFWIENPEENPLTMNWTTIELTFRRGGFGAPGAAIGGP